MNEVVSIIIPAYNSSNFICQSIESVLSQTYKNIEVIVVDDGSTDDTRQKALSYKLHGVKVLINPKKGACAARNFGFENSTGGFIQFLDADDVLAPDKIESQIKVLLSHGNPNELLVHGKWGRFRDNEQVYFWGPDTSISKDLVPVEWLIQNHMSITGCWLTPRNLIEKGGGWNEELKRNQDGEFFSRIMLRASKVLYCDEAKVYYRSGIANSISSTKNIEAVLSAYKSIELIEQYIFSLENSTRTRLAVANIFQSFVLEHYVLFPELAKKAEEKVKELGGATLKLQGGKVLRFFGKVFGWKNALEVKKVIVRLK